MNDKSRGGILGTGSALGDITVTNDQLSAYLDTSDEWIRQRVGIQRRQIASPEQSADTLALVAAEKALEASQLAPTDLDLIIVATETPDKLLPGTSFFLQGELGATNAFVFDLRAACSGFLFALITADSLLKQLRLSTALVVGTECISRYLDWQDRNTAVIFGDGAGAAVLREKRPQGGPILAAELKCDGSQRHLICREQRNYPRQKIPSPLNIPPLRDEQLAGSPYVSMIGREVFKIAVPAMISSSQIVLERAGISSDEIKLFIPHQANERIIEAVGTKLGIPREKTVIQLPEVGNTSAASIPMALDQAVRQGRLTPGDLILLSAAGAGMSWGAALIRW